MLVVVPQANAILSAFSGQIRGMVTTSIPGLLPGMYDGYVRSPSGNGFKCDSINSTHTNYISNCSNFADGARFSRFATDCRSSYINISRSMSITSSTMFAQRAPSIESPMNAEWSVKGASNLNYTQLFDRLEKTRSEFLTGTRPWSANAIKINSEITKLQQVAQFSAIRRW